MDGNYILQFKPDQPFFNFRPNRKENDPTHSQKIAAKDCVLFFLFTFALDLWVMRALTITVESVTLTPAFAC